MLKEMTSQRLDEIYNTARNAGALGGKIMGAGGGGFFMFYCDSAKAKERVLNSLQNYNLRKVALNLDDKGSRTKIIEF